MYVLGLVAAALASAIYLLPADVRIVTWTTGAPERLAMLPPLARLWMGAALGIGAVGGMTAINRAHGVNLRRTAAAITPMMLLALWSVPYLPWLPDRAPLLLLLTGPARWIVAGVAVAWTAANVVRWRPRPLAVPRVAVFAITLVVYLWLGARFTDAVGLSGDEPHYLVIAHSLLVDHDLDIANNHEQRDYRAFYDGTLRPDYLRRGRNGEIYSIHPPGLPALLLPAYAVGGARAAVWTMGLIGALAALAIFDLAAMVAGTTTAAVTWVASCFTVPFVPHAWLIYPELACAAAVAWSLRFTQDSRPSLRRSFANGLLLAALPWLHTKFIVFAALLGAWHALRLSRRAPQAVSFVTPLLLSVVAWLFAFFWMYGTFDPQAPYGGSAATSMMAANIPRSVLGMLFDQKFGLLIFSPVFVLAIAGIVLLWRDPRFRPLAIGSTVVGTAFVLSTARFYMWWGGASAPARFLVPIVPVLAPLVAAAVARWQTVGGRAVVASSIAASLAIACAGIATPSSPFFFSHPHGTSSLLQAMEAGAPLVRSLPTFTEENWSAPARLLLAWLAALAIGCSVAAAGVRARIMATPWTVATTTVAVAAFLAAAFVGGRWSGDRSAISRAGRLELLRQFDPSRLRLVDVSRLARVGASDVAKALTVSIDRTAIDDAVVLPAGDYEARAWFAADHPIDGAVNVSLARQIVLGGKSGTLANPTAFDFRLDVSAPALIGVSEGAATAALQHVEIVPRAVAPSARGVGAAMSVEPVPGMPSSYMTYVDDGAYAEGGVFWTRDTAAAHVVLAPAGAAHLRLTLHAGPPGGQVAVDVGTQHQRVDLRPDETRDLVVDLPPGAKAVPMAFQASRSFRPSDVDKSSDDQRRLGCQVRPVVF